MAVPGRAVEKTVFTGDSGESRAMHLHKSCGYIDCQEHGIASLGDEDLCCDHFVLRCYDLLQQIDGGRKRGESEIECSSALMEPINNCLQGALDVSLRSASLNNLQKARLLDIMLWAGEFLYKAEERRFTKNRQEDFPAQGPEQRSPYQKPLVKSRTTLLSQ